MKNRTKLIRMLIFALATVFCLGMLFTSCGDDSKTTPTQPTTQPTTAPTKPVTPTSSATGTTDSSNGGTTDPSEGTTDPSEGTTDPSEGTTDPSEGTTDPSEGTTDPSEGTTDPSEGTTDTSNNVPEDKPCTEHKGGTATCTKKAECEACGEEYGDFAPHTEEVVPGKAATCTETGLKDGKKCSVCGETLVEQETIPVASHKYDNEIKVVEPTCIADGYTVYGCSAGDCGLTENRDFVTERTSHSYSFDAELEEYDVLACDNCGCRIVNITTGIEEVEGSFCLGICGATGDEPCTCDTTVEWKGYSKPAAPEAIVGGEAFVKEQAENAAFEIGGGMIKLVSESDANYTVTIGEEKIEVSGTEVLVDLSKYDSVTSVTIESDADATVVFYMPLA